MDCQGFNAYEKFVIKLGHQGLVLSLCSAVVILGGCVSDSSGLVAYKRGEYSAALKKFRADRTPEGNFALGLMYSQVARGKRTQ